MPGETKGQVVSGKDGGHVVLHDKLPAAPPFMTDHHTSGSSPASLAVTMASPIAAA